MQIVVGVEIPGAVTPYLEIRIGSRIRREEESPEVVWIDDPGLSRKTDRLRSVEMDCLRNHPICREPSPAGGGDSGGLPQLRLCPLSTVRSDLSAL